MNFTKLTIQVTPMNLLFIIGVYSYIFIEYHFDIEGCHNKSVRRPPCIYVHLCASRVEYGGVSLLGAKLCTSVYFRTIMYTKR